ncbi:hypothetical protein SAMN04489712_106337 [Thermomonospora echinospora]|uniref:Uncharacterized protein n=1 Tax=Thermomonospora echinospora TaxID=1992 RepID=A0A1H6B9E8_9ACTN|nr:hypothetical protein [Thermomonospora echinospora]SEG56796.1 hypothetical protein SAMN04489712_106337 [Thermomonospora echinospora]
MADAWLPGAGRIPAELDGGQLKGGAPRVVWFTSEHDPRSVSARSAAHDLARTGRPAHLVWNPHTGEIVQLLPATRAACLLADPVRGEGRVCLQILVIGLAREPFTGGPLNGLDAIMRWLDGWGVPRRWPAGPPLPSPQSYHSDRQRRPWARGGHFGASQVPECVLPDPGGLDIHRITGQDTPAVEIPRPRPPAGQRTTPATPAASGAPPQVLPHRLARTAEPLLTPGPV